ncbi:unnamed protein product [Closterium sp. Naga37s-1]|nr:unnamed protein product [Closterium sp. Naga37s-1]
MRGFCQLVPIQATEAGGPVLNRRRVLMRGPRYAPIGPLDLYGALDAALEGGLGPYEVVMRSSGFLPFLVWVHSALAIPSRILNVTLLKQHYARAIITHHGGQAFSFVEFCDAHGALHHGRLYLLLTTDITDEDVEASDIPLAFIRWFSPIQMDECTGFMAMRPETGAYGYAIVAVGFVRCTVHMHPSSCCFAT